MWLQNVVDAMRAALSHEFKAAIPAYDEKPRIKWIFDYSVQNTIVVSRTFFTQEVRAVAPRSCSFGCSIDPDALRSTSSQEKCSPVPVVSC